MAKKMLNVSDLDLINALLADVASLDGSSESRCAEDAICGQYLGTHPVSVIATKSMYKAGFVGGLASPTSALRDLLDRMASPHEADIRTASNAVLLDLVIGCGAAGEVLDVDAFRQQRRRWDKAAGEASTYVYLADAIKGELPISREQTRRAIVAASKDWGGTRLYHCF